MVNENVPIQRTAKGRLFNMFKGNMEKDSVLLIQNLLQYIMSSSINHFGQNYTF